MAESVVNVKEYLTLLQVAHGLDAVRRDLSDQEKAIVSQLVDQRLAELDDPPDRDSMLEEFTRQTLELKQADLPSEYQDPILYDMLMELADRTERMLGETLQPGHTRPVMGTAPHGRLDPIALSPEGADDVLFVFDSKFFNFVHVFTRAFVRALPLHSSGDGSTGVVFDPEKIQAHIKEDSETHFRFQDWLMAVVMKGDARLAEPFALDDNREALANLFGVAINTFSLSQIYLAGLLSPEYPWRVTPFEDEVHEPGSLLVPNEMAIQTSEKIAVSFAANTMAEFEHEPPMGIAAVYLYFHALQVMERSMALIVNGNEKKTVPVPWQPSRERMKRLDKQLKDDLGEDGAKVFEAFNSTIATTMDTLFEPMVGVLKKLRDDGYVRDPSWDAISLEA